MSRVLKMCKKNKNYRHHENIKWNELTKLNFIVFWSRMNSVLIDWKLSNSHLSSIHIHEKFPYFICKLFFQFLFIMSQSWCWCHSLILILTKLNSFFVDQRRRETNLKFVFVCFSQNQLNYAEILQESCQRSLNSTDRYEEHQKKFTKKKPICIKI